MSSNHWRSRIVRSENMDPRGLAANPSNWRTHPELQTNSLVGVLDEVGWVGRVIWNERTKRLIDGHLRVKQAVARGEMTVPVDVVDLSSEEEDLILATFDPLTALAEADAGKLRDLLYRTHANNPATQELLDRLRASVSSLSTSDDEATPEPPVVPCSRRGDVWLLGRHRLMCGDFTDSGDVTRLMGDQVADCVFTSPPYAVGIDYGTYQDTIDNLREMLPILARTCWESLLPGGFAVINFGDIVSGRGPADSEAVCEYPMSLEYWPVFRSAGFALWSRRVWCKPVARVAAPWCASSNRSATNFEHVWTWKKDGVPIVGRVPGPMDSQTGWFDTSRMEGVDVGKEVHGAGMPLSTALWMLNVHSRPGRVVLEPFCGTGTTLLACERLARVCHAMEIEPKFVDVTIARFDTAFPNLVNLESSGARLDEVRAERMGNG